MSSRIYDLARKLDVPSRELIEILKKHGIEIKSHMSTVDESTANLIFDALGKKKKEPSKREGISSKEKKAETSRTYIPPRKRRRRKPERAKTPENFQQREEQAHTKAEPDRSQRSSFSKDERTKSHYQSARQTSESREQKAEDLRKKPAPSSRRQAHTQTERQRNLDKKPSVSKGSEKGTSVQRDRTSGARSDRDSSRRKDGQFRQPRRGKNQGRRRDTPGTKEQQNEKPHFKDHGQNERGERSEVRKREQGSSSSNATPSQRTRPQGRQTGQRTRPQGQQTGQRTRPQEQQTGQRTRPQGQQTGQRTRPQGQQTGQRTRPQEQQTGQRTRPQGQQTGQRTRPQGQQTGQRTRPQGQQTGQRTRSQGQRSAQRTRPGAPTQRTTTRAQRTAHKTRAKAPVHKAPELKPKVEEIPKRFEVAEVITVKELAEKMHVPPAKIIQHLISVGIMANVNQVLDTEAAKSIGEHLGFEVVAVSADEEKDIQEEAVDESKLKPRPPVVTIMGHVDHGKTTLLDAIRKSKITDSEFGGITQHIGAYSVDIEGQEIVFLDTPGHEAFTSMRARGAKVTDEVILVVAADDGIMPQTIEAIDHARAAEVPIIVAINKMDVPGANPDRVMQEMTKYGLTPEEWGGDTICVKVSAKTQENLDELLEMLLLQAEMLELKADPDRLAKGVIVEALLDKGRGPVATVLVQSGTLRIGDPFVVGMHHGKVRAMLDDKGRRLKEAGPATPVEVLGLTGVPVAGDSFTVVDSERKARQISESRQDDQQKAEFAKTAKITLEELHHRIKDGETQELRIVIKADVHGSVEALGEALERLSTEKVRLQPIHGGVGAINESDVMLAMASNAIVIGFNVRPVAKARELAEKEQIDVRLYNVIYQAIDDVKKAMEGLLEPVYKEVLIGQAQVLALFSLPKGGTVAGCRVTNGKIARNSVVRLMRDNKEIFKGNIASLRRVKDDVREVLTGYECGIRLENYNDIKEHDVIESYTLEKLAVSLDGTTTSKED